jgi:hypothetical protein
VTKLKKNQRSPNRMSANLLLALVSTVILGSSPARLPDGKPEGFISQETPYVTATKPSRLMLFRETVSVYCENHMEHTDTLCGQNAGFLMLKQVVHIVTNVV